MSEQNTQEPLCAASVVVRIISGVEPSRATCGKPKSDACHDFPRRPVPPGPPGLPTADCHPFVEARPKPQLTAERALDLSAKLQHDPGRSHVAEAVHYLEGFAAQQATIERLAKERDEARRGVVKFSEFAERDRMILDLRRAITTHEECIGELEYADENRQLRTSIAERDRMIEEQAKALDTADTDFRRMHDDLTQLVSEQSAIIRAVSRGVEHIGGSATLPLTVAKLRAALAAAEEKLKACEDYADLLSQAAQVYASEHPESSLTERVCAAAKKIRGER